jgi:hypothetical protein
MLHKKLKGIPWRILMTKEEIPHDQLMIRIKIIPTFQLRGSSFPGTSKKLQSHRIPNKPNQLGKVRILKAMKMQH